MSEPYFEIRDLHASINGKQILKGVTLEIGRGEVHALMGPNGSGKSTLSSVIMGHPAYEVTGGEIIFKGVNLMELDPEDRAALGVFLAFQYPVAIPGVNVSKFLKTAQDAILKDKKQKATEFLKEMRGNMEYLEMDPAFANRGLNEGFSGGEKKRMEILQMLMLKPGFAIMDETDSGLDIDALKIVADGVNALRGPKLGVLLITHYQRLLDYIVPDYVHVMWDGRIVKSGDKSLALELEAKGYDWVKELAAVPAK